MDAQRTPFDQGVIFDLDGTLLDTLDDLANSMNAALAREGLPPHDPDRYRFLVGDGVETLARRAVPEGDRQPERVDRLVTAMREEYGRRWAERTRPYPGIPELLATLAERGIPTAVLSNKMDDFTLRSIRRFFPDHHFVVVRGARVGVPAKPDPTAALEIREEFGLSGDRILYVGDTDTDMKTAVAAGLVPVGVLWGFRTERELIANGARILLERPADLLRHLPGG